MLVKSSQVKSSQVKSSPKIVYLINNSFKIFLISLLFSICCKPKQEPTEEIYNGLIPKEFSGKYIRWNGAEYINEDYFETTSSNTIISGTSLATAGKGIIPISHRTTTSSRITYDALNNNNDCFIFYTNNQSKRELILGSRASSGWSRTFIHADDINK